jgi:hypothetical protein
MPEPLYVGEAKKAGPLLTLPILVFENLRFTPPHLSME